MGTKSFFVFCLFFFLTGCASHRKNLSDDQVHKRSVSLATKCHETACAMFYRNLTQKSFPSDDRFYLSYEETDLFPLKKKPLPYQGVEATIHFPPLQPNSQYVLYCPFTGCPEAPELQVEIKTDEEGNIIPAEMFDELKKYNIKTNPVHIVLLYANPGYCSDWYLMKTSPFSSLHTTFTYKPIMTSGNDGRTLILNKKEPGGNILELLLKNFPPNKKVTIISTSAGSACTDIVTVKEDGSYDLAISAPVPGFTKGIYRITVLSDNGPLEISCEWDSSTLDIKRLIPPSDLWCGIFANPPIDHREQNQPCLDPKLTQVKQKNVSV